MNPAKSEYKAVLSLQETAELLRSVAKALESGHITIQDLHLPLEADHGINVSFKKDSQKETFRLKLKYKGHSFKAFIAGETVDSGGRTSKKTKPTEPIHPSAASTTPSKPRKESYSRLKKRMKKDFQAIKEALEKDVLPSLETAARFIRDSRAMITYPGKGDPHYQDYQHAASDLETRLNHHDLDALKEACVRIEALWHSCHDKYK